MTIIGKSREYSEGGVDILDCGSGPQSIGAVAAFSGFSPSDPVNSSTFRT